jgi:hypothetical protein
VRFITLDSPFNKAERLFWLCPDYPTPGHKERDVVLREIRNDQLAFKQDTLAEQRRAFDIDRKFSNMGALALPRSLRP